ncbi:hypothetical protein WMY93_013048 [Mugilogobius chulae]|uniref:HAT C-terminal dimerisation domain-containing protein n=1 Tax=Mugilogobius chulae TaxID=88201 RepID=A0AAW0P2Y5_9GOBI
MTRHYKTLHDNQDASSASTSGTNTTSRKDILNKCLINIIIKDCQPVSIVEDVGFREMLQVLEPSYAIPSRKVTRSVINDWGISEKVRCLVTDGGANIIASARILQIRHSYCIAHSLNLIVKKSCDQVPALLEIRNKTKQIVTYFRSSTTGKEKLTEIQKQMGKPVLKLINEVPTRWNSTYQMFARIVEQKEPVWVTLATLNSQIPPLTTEEVEIISESLSVLGPFDIATLELSQEKRVCGSKVIPILKMLHYSLHNSFQKLNTIPAKHLCDQLLKRLVEAISSFETSSTLSLATLLDPRYKVIGFLSSAKASEAVKRLKSECAAEMRSSTAPSPHPHPGPSSTPASSDSLWHQLDLEILQSQKQSNVMADAIIEVQRYLSGPNSPRSQDPIEYWETQRSNFPHLFKLAQKFLSTPASSVPCERVFSKAGELVSKRRNRLGPSLLQKLLFLNKNV